MPSRTHVRAGRRAAGAPDVVAWIAPPPERELRPPWARAGDAFDDACTRCGACVDACPTHVLKLADGRVRVDYADGECTFCGRCVASCPEPAFDAAAYAAGAAAWTAVARIDATCLARLGVGCTSCGDACDAHAIRFRIHAGAVPDPRVDAHRCTGCGACVRVCPASAIDVAIRPVAAPHA
jgi:ferredoxin-type protein NapF